MTRPVLRIAYMEEWDGDFIRWTSNFLRRFIEEGSIALVRQNQEPNLIFASIWRKQDFPKNLPVVLVSNENWRFWKPHQPLSFYKAVLGLYPPAEPCTFIAFPYAAAHFDVPVERLYRMREDFMGMEKTRFCCFVSSNPSGPLAAARMALFEEIDRWKRVDSGGRVLNNLGYLAPGGLDYLLWVAQYRYMICFENFKEPNYITEKPFLPWFAGTVPIYDGGCVDELNQNAIVNAARGDVVEQLKMLEERADLYEAKRHARLRDTPISLSSFEERFRALLLDPA